MYEDFEVAMIVAWVVALGALLGLLIAGLAGAFDEQPEPKSSFQVACERLGGEVRTDLCVKGNTIILDGSK